MVIVGGGLRLIGAVWIGPGVGLIGGSFMTGHGVSGALAFVAGLADLRRTARLRRFR